MPFNHTAPVPAGDRGIAYYPRLLTEDGGEIKVCESSASRSPHVHLRVGLASSIGPHLDADTAWKLADQLRHAVRNHYQGDATPEWAREGGL